jgi:hypothetical protein
MKRPVTWMALSVLALGIAGCSSSEPAGVDARPPSAAASAPSSGQAVTKSPLDHKSKQSTEEVLEAR